MWLRVTDLTHIVPGQGVLQWQLGALVTCEDVEGWMGRLREEFLVSCFEGAGILGGVLDNRGLDPG